MEEQTPEPVTSEQTGCEAPRADLRDAFEGRLFAHRDPAKYQAIKDRIEQGDYEVLSGLVASAVLARLGIKQ